MELRIYFCLNYIELEIKIKSLRNVHLKLFKKKIVRTEKVNKTIIVFMMNKLACFFQ